MANIYVVDIEPIETRYTAQWQKSVPALLRSKGHNVSIISGPSDIPAATTPGAFLNFGGTNVYKAAQVEKMGRLFCDGAIKPGDHFIFTDAWNPGVINLKYMSELLGIPVVIHGLHHAGSWDRHDFLGRLLGGAQWVRAAEESFFHAYDHNYFATDFHIDMFSQTHAPVDASEVWIKYHTGRNKIVRTGWPMEYMQELLGGEVHSKRDLIVFPHRIAPEKQVEIFRDLATQMPQYEFVVCQDQQLTKHQYHDLLKQAKMVFSCSLQETLGISPYEGALVGAMPLVPNRLSYSEMYADEFMYPSQWTADWAGYLEHQDELIARITTAMNDYDKHLPLINKQVESLTANFFTADKLLQTIGT